MLCSFTVYPLFRSQTQTMTNWMIHCICVTWHRNETEPGSLLHVMCITQGVTHVYVAYRDLGSLTTYWIVWTQSISWSKTALFHTQIHLWGYDHMRKVVGFSIPEIKYILYEEEFFLSTDQYQYHYVASHASDSSVILIAVRSVCSLPSRYHWDSFCLWLWTFMIFKHRSCYINLINTIYMYEAQKENILPANSINYFMWTYIENFHQNDLIRFRICTDKSSMCYSVCYGFYSSSTCWRFTVCNTRERCHRQTTMSMRDI